MYRSMRRWLAVAGVMVIAAGANAETTWYVDDDNCPGPGNGSEGSPFCQVQAAIDIAVSGDTILVLPGTYVQAIDYKGKTLAIRSTDGPEVTTLDGDFQNSVVRLRGAEGVGTLLEGFTITNGRGFSNGSVYLGGGISTLNSFPTIRNNIIINNRASYGGGVDVDHGHTILDHNVITGNIAEDTHIILHISGDGGGVSVFRGQVTMLGNEIYNNRAYRDGGGIWGDLAPADTMPIVLRDNLIYNNTSEGTEGGGAGKGGGMFFEANSSIEITGCTFTGNSGADAGDGITLRSDGDLAATLYNSVVYGNGSTSGDGREVDLLSVTLDVSYCDIEAGEGGITANSSVVNWGAGNVDVDPMFKDLEADDYHLDNCSPLVNAGDPAFVPQSGETDVDGNERVLRGAVDIGADEVVFECGAGCTGSERIGGAKCRLKNGVNKMTVKLMDGVPGDTFTVTLSSGPGKSGTIKDTGRGKAKFSDLPAGPGTATAEWGCGAVDAKGYDCP
ncbi:MAG: hypothetical protein IT449_14525 [Phycisphaerales bacterium]|nr:hypothetical protein [Phycisphaerales bacterium]